MSAYDNIGQCAHNAHHLVEEQLGLPDAVPHLLATAHCFTRWLMFSMAARSLWRPR